MARRCLNLRFLMMLLWAMRALHCLALVMAFHVLCGLLPLILAMTLFGLAFLARALAACWAGLMLAIVSGPS